MTFFVVWGACSSNASKRSPLSNEGEKQDKTTARGLFWRLPMSNDE